MSHGITIVEILKNSLAGKKVLIQNAFSEGSIDEGIVSDIEFDTDYVREICCWFLVTFTSGDTCLIDNIQKCKIQILAT